MREVKIKLDYEACDKLFLDLLYEGYETCYWCYKDDLRMILKDPVKNAYKQEDVDHNETVLEAYETLARHYSSRDQDADGRLQALRDRVDVKGRIAAGMTLAGRNHD